jgi:hypothetical protein
VRVRAASATARATTSAGRRRHRGEQGVARLHDAPPLRVARRRRVVVGDDVRDVREVPAGRGQVEGEQLLLAAHAVPLGEAARLQVGVAPHDGAAGDEAEHRRARAARGPDCTGRGRHLEAHRVELLVEADQHRGGQHASRGWRSSTSTARASAPGAHQESSSAKAT